MTKHLFARDEVFRYLQGFYLTDNQQSSLGIKDDQVRRDLCLYLIGIYKVNEKEFSTILRDYLCENYLSDEMLDQGYTASDVISFVDWFVSFFREYGYDIT